VLSGQTRTASGTFEIRSRDAAADRWVSVRAGSVLDDEGEADLAITIWHDVTVERHEQRRVKYVAGATLALSGSLDEKAMLGALARALVPGLAATCSIHLVDGDGVTRVAAAGVDPGAAASESERSATEAALRRAVISGETAVLEGALLTPIVARSLVLGVIALERPGSDHPYTRADMQLAEELGRRAGVALENARLYTDAQRAVRAADQASRAKDEFLATVSHELRTPLSAILGWSQMLKERVTDPALKKPLEVVHRNALAQVRIIDDILEVSRIITGKFQIEIKPADLVAIARDAIEAVRPSATHKRLELRFEPSAEYRFLTADPDRLQQAVWNLLTNAVKFTKDGGSIVVREWQVGPELFLSVSDTGAGIAPEFLPHVFDRFWQADSSTTRRVGGLGLGLALVRHIVERHGGTVEVASEGVGRGATFTLRVPVQASQRPAPEAWETTSEPPHALPTKGLLAGLRILVVDDEEDARDVIACSLGEAGATVEAVGSALEALPRLASFHPHVLVSDIGMPGEDGFALLRRVRSLPDTATRDVPALALTAFARAEDRAQAIAAGFTAHLGKPVTPDTLVQRVRELARPA
jgi:signal transduction histidine kinase